MRSLSASKAIFREKTVSKRWLVEHLDVLLMVFFGIDETDRSEFETIGKEIRHFTAQSAREEYRSSFSPFAEFFGSPQDGLKEAMEALHGIFAAVHYEPERDVSRIIDEFLTAIVSDGWRDDDNLEFPFNENDYRTLFRLSCWVVEQFGKILRGLAEHSPFDFEGRKLIASLRDLAYDRTKSLDEMVRNLDVFHAELGSRRFCPVPAHAQFWHSVGYKFDQVHVHPVDEDLEERIPFMAAMGLMQMTLLRHSSASGTAFAERGAATQLEKELTSVLAVWDGVLEKHFHLGPTVELLKRTMRVMSKCRVWIATPTGAGDDAPDSSGAQFRSYIDGAFKTFEAEASKLLREE